MKKILVIPIVISSLLLASCVYIPVRPADYPYGVPVQVHTTPPPVYVGPIWGWYELPAQPGFFFSIIVDGNGRHSHQRHAFPRGLRFPRRQ